MKLSYLILSLIILPVLFHGHLYAQDFIQGTIVNEKTRSAVPYATIGLLKSNTGTNADESGKFRLKIFTNADDTVIISSVGYQTLKIKLSVAISNDTFSLMPKYIQLKSITVSNKNEWTSETVGKFDDCGDYGLVSSGFQTQVAKLFQSNRENALLSSVTICCKTFLFSSEKSIFRLRIYNQDSVTGRPSEELCSEVIEVSQKNKKTEVDLEPYRIWLPHKNFFIAVEWLIIPSNKEAKSKGRKANQLPCYYPRIGAKNVEPVTKDTWMLTYRNVWSPMTGHSVSISASIKY